MVPRAIRPFWMFARFLFKEVVCMDSEYYYYYFDDCNLINYTNYQRRNKKYGEEFV